MFDAVERHVTQVGHGDRTREILAQRDVGLIVAQWVVISGTSAG
jgi:hypothetical protein